MFMIFVKYKRQYSDGGDLQEQQALLKGLRPARKTRGRTARDADLEALVAVVR